MDWNMKSWRRSIEEFPEFLEPLVGELGRTERREGATLYVQGLLLPGERKSIEPMAQRLGVDSQKLQQFVADSPWEEAQVWRAIRREVVPALEPIAAWIVDETGWVKQGEKSVGVAHQYCGSVGKQANCQVSVELVVSDGQIAAPIAGRLYLPQKWAEDPVRREKAGVPADVVFQTKPAIAGALIEEALADGVPPAPVLGDEVYGASGELRALLRRRGIEYMLNAGGDLNAWTGEVKTRFAKKYWDVADGQPPARNLEALSRSLDPSLWHPVSWRAADQSVRRTRIAFVPIHLYSDLDRLTGDWPQTWLVVDWSEGDAAPYHLYVAWFKRAPSATRCLRLSRGHFPIEQCFQRKKTDLGFDHYEGRSWRGFHHHLVLSAVAYLFVLSMHLRSKKNSWCYVGTGVARDSAVVGAVNRLLRLLRDEV
ncbi:MAG: IS701 family transposase [Verrucomicrobia bacterium]|nr:IS701 family transposase [Verrucomicrobiota bacterium]